MSAPKTRTRKRLTRRGALMLGGIGLAGVAGLYVVAMVFLGLHLHHGAWSMLQTLGLAHPRYTGKLKLVPPAIGLGVAGGNILLVLSVLAGIVK